MRYLSLRTDSTQDSAPIACQCLQCGDRQPSTRNRAEPRQEDFFPAPFRLPLEQPEADKKGALPLRPRFFRPCWAKEEEGAADACVCDQDTTGEVPPQSAEEADEDPALTGPAADFPRNLRWMQGPLNKSVNQSRTHLGQGRVEQR